KLPESSPPILSISTLRCPGNRLPGMGDVLVHDYFGIDASIVWAVGELELPVLKKLVLAMLSGKKERERQADDLPG
ncbi:MAG TPA: HepT-like ribonuclease domain-containing protein, partial [Blastocatellia bacterium]|nr:HepT-like ribonuclease domain-containing protein [Blastocatellia bacterium]